MPEPPDFEKIARQILEPWIDEVRWHGTQANPTFQKDIEEVAEQLRLVWNARGAADLAAIEALQPTADRDPSPSMKTLDRALRSLDSLCQHERDPLAPVTTGNPPTWRCRKCGTWIPGALIRSILPTDRNR